MQEKSRKDRNQKEAKHKYTVRNKLKDDTKYKSKSNKENLANQFEILSECDETGYSDSFQSNNKKE